MTEQRIQPKHQENADRFLLPRKVEEAEQSGLWNVWLSILIVGAPILLMLGWEFGSRVVHPPERSLPRPWVTYNSPYPPLSQYHWTGDLRRIARLPYYDREVESGPYPRRYAHRITDEWGFVNPPTGYPPRPVNEGQEIILTGSSEMAEGSTVEKTLSEQLEALTGKGVFNASWPGGSPVQGLLRILTDPDFYQGRDQIVLLGIIQRYLFSGTFDEVKRYINEDGTVKETFRTAQPVLTLDDYMKWRLQIENYLETTSAVREWAVYPGRFLPPMALDRGYNSPVRISWLETNGHAPILFYPEDIRSTYVSYEDRGGDDILKAIQRIQKRCEQMNLRLILLLVPDKYELYRDHLEPKLYPKQHLLPMERYEHPKKRAPQVLTEKLHAAGIEAIDLFPILYQTQFQEGGEKKLMFWVDDTHWSDDGIAVAAETVTDYLSAPSR